MSRRGIRRTLYLIAAAECIASIGIVLWAVSQSSVAVSRDIQPPAAVSSPTSRGVDFLSSLGQTADDTQRITQRRLQAPLVDPPPSPPPTLAPPPPLRLQLVGTIIEPGRSVAIVTAGDGTTRFAPTGTLVDDAEIVGIDRGSVKVRYAGQSITLTVPRTDR